MTDARIRVFALAVSDALCMGGIILLTAFTYRHFGGRYEMRLYYDMWPIIPIFLCSNGFIRLYHGNFFYPGTALCPVEELRRLFFSVSLAFLMLLSYLVLFRLDANHSRLVLSVSWMLTVLSLAPARWMVRTVLRNMNIGQIDVIVAGAGRTGLILAEEFRKDRHFGFRVAGFLDDDAALGSGSMLPKPLLGKLDDAVSIAKNMKIQYLICCLPLTAVQSHLKDYIRYFRHIMIVPDNQVLPISWAYPVSLHGISGIELKNQLLLPLPRMLKYCLEMIMASCAMIVLFPVFVVLAAVVKLGSPGPVFYRAKRLGLNGKTIEVWKFRTMYKDADERLKKLLAEDAVFRAEWEDKFKVDNDPRITPLGRFLRKSSLDELPQFLNVLRGEMAVIGPRPIVDDEKKYYGDEYAVFSRVKPGITGLWQVSGRSETTYERRVALDMYYILNWSIWLDYYILLKTIKEVLFCKGAK